MAGAFLFLLVFRVYRSIGAKETATAVPVRDVHSVVVRPTTSPGGETRQAFQASDFYRTIIENNLFRPLGWRASVPVEPYRLIGTLLPRDATPPPQALLHSATGNTTQIVSPGEKIDDHTKVVSIEHKQVVLKTDGKQRTLRLTLRY